MSSSPKPEPPREPPSRLLSGTPSNPLLAHPHGLPLGSNSVRNIGITVLFQPQEPEKTIADILFVHGLQGHPRDTWTWESNAGKPVSSKPIEGKPHKKKKTWFGFRKKDKSHGDASKTAQESDGDAADNKKETKCAAVFWPYHLLSRECPRARILTWGYDSRVSNFFGGSANKNNILSHSNDLLENLEWERRQEVLLYANDSDEKGYQDLYKSTNAILFLGTPHRGSDYADLGETIRGIVSVAGFDTASQNTRALEIDGQFLKSSHERFQRLHKRSCFEVYTFQEAHGMTGTGFFKLNEKVVPDISSEFPGEKVRVSINANHMSMCRYSSDEDDGYRKVARRLNGLCQTIRTQEEEAARLERKKGQERVEREREKERKRAEELNAIDIACLDTLSFLEMNYRQLEVQNTCGDPCSWILQHPAYTEWKECHGLLWIKGKPGSGKSTLMKKIFQLFDEDVDHIRLAFFFHRRGTSLQQTQIGMFRTLLHQLLKQVPSVRAEFRSLYEDKKKSGRYGTDWDWNIAELKHGFKSALLAAARNHTIRIFVDALDEAGEESARAVVSYLYELNESLRPESQAATSICFSCRHHPIVATNHGFQICLENENHQDIETYVFLELERKILSQDEGSTRDKDLKVLLHDISSKASGVFLWATLVVPMVTKQYNEGESLETVQETLRQVPSDLGDVYRHILTYIVDPKDKARRLHLMQWICLAVRPLSLTELRFAMASDDTFICPSQYSCQESPGFVKDDAQMKRRILSLSGGLAEVKHHDNKHTVQFIHQSVNDFLATGGFQYLDPSSTEDPIGIGHSRLSRSCINCLKLGEVLREERTWGSWIIKQELPFVEYAIKSWFMHAEKAESRGILQKGLVEFPWQAFETWIKIYRAIDRYSDKCPNQGSTLLHIASSSNLQSTVRLLLQRGISIEEEDSSGNRALHYAARWGHGELTNMLLDEHAEIGAKNNAGSTPLERAAGNGHEEVVKLLLKRGANINERTGDSGNALQAAALKGSTTLVQTLVESGAEVNAQGGHYGNALQAAAWNGREAVVQLLLDKGAEVNAQGGQYGNALQAAARDGREAVVQLLLDKGAEVNAQGGHYGNALQAAACDGREAVVQLLLDKGAEVNAQGGQYGNALQAAAWNGHEAVVQLLLDKGAEVNAQGGHYGNALEAAKGSKAMTKLLVDRGAKPMTLPELEVMI